MHDQGATTIAETVEKAVEVAETAVRQPVVKKFARIGFYAKGLLYMVVGALAVMLAMGLPEGRIADPTGAMAVVAHRPFGKFLLVAFIVGAAGHAVWNILRALADVDDAGKGFFGIFKRSIAGGIGIFYLGLALTALEFVLSLRRDAPSQAEETFVAILLAIPILGTILLFLIGLGVIGAGFHECYSGLSGKYREAYRLWEIKGGHLTFITILGVLSFSARAVILIIMGYFMIWAAFWNRLEGSIGLDAALLTLSQTNYGRILLLAVGVGLYAHGVLALYEAKYRRLC